MFEHAILVDTRFMGEGVGSNDRLIWLHGDAGVI